MAAARRPMVDGYLIIDRSSGLVRAFRTKVIDAYAVSDAHPDSVVMLVRIPADQEVLYRTAELSRGDVPAPKGDFVRTVPPKGGR